MGNLLLRRRMMGGEKALDYGVYIQDTNGKLWKAGTWDGSATFNGVAVYTEECAFVMRQGADAKKMVSASTSNVSSSLIEYPTEQEAKADFKGIVNTEFLKSVFPAKAYVEDNPFPDGVVGYIPSLGELWKAYEYKDEVNALFVEATGGVFTDAIYGSSTLESGAGEMGRRAYFWTLDFGTGAVTSALSTSTSTYIRPFKDLWIPDVMPKRENKIICKYSGLGSATDIINYAYVFRAEYPVYSDVVVEYEYKPFPSSTVTWTGTATIAKGSTHKTIEETSQTTHTIISVTPTEDDRYIYKF